LPGKQLSSPSNLFLFFSLLLLCFGFPPRSAASVYEAYRKTGRRRFFFFLSPRVGLPFFHWRRSFSYFLGREFLAFFRRWPLFFVSAPLGAWSDWTLFPSFDPCALSLPFSPLFCQVCSSLCETCLAHFPFLAVTFLVTGGRFRWARFERSF